MFLRVRNQLKCEKNKSNTKQKTQYGFHYLWTTYGCIRCDCTLKILTRVWHFCVNCRSFWYRNQMQPLRQIFSLTWLVHLKLWKECHICLFLDISYLTLNYINTEGRHKWINIQPLQLFVSQTQKPCFT